MTYYRRKVDELTEDCFSNKAQLETAISIKRYIDNNFTKNFNLEKLSRETFVSKFHLIRLFKKYYGQTPRQYLIDKRMEAAKDHLKNGMLVGETCYAVGFESISTFSLLFSQRNGRPPKKFRKSNLR